MKSEPFLRVAQLYSCQKLLKGAFAPDEELLPICDSGDPLALDDPILGTGAGA